MNGSNTIVWKTLFENKAFIIFQNKLNPLIWTKRKGKKKKKHLPIKKRKEKKSDTACLVGDY